jgi:RNA-directed DNA polymerase
MYRRPVLPTETRVLWQLRPDPGFHPGHCDLRHAARRRKARGLGKPETFDFLGFTHICGKTRDGRFGLRRVTISKRMRAELHELKDELMRRRHQPFPEQGRWLGSVVRGHCAYYAVHGPHEGSDAPPADLTRACK